MSAVVVDKDGKNTHYGNIKQCKSDGDASGQIEINLYGVLSCGNDTKVYVFNEQLNGDKKTDYASKLIEITVPATAEHNYVWESMNDEKHWHECTVCHEKKDEAVHTWDAGKVTKNATTTATGIKTHTCTACKATKTVTIPKLAKKANPLTIKAKTATIKYAAVKKKAQVVGVTKVIAFTKKGQGKMTYTKASGNKKITINKTTGKVTVKKGLKKGTYKVKVKVKAAGNANYKASAVKTVIFKIKVR